MSVATKHKKDCCGCNACVEICPKHCIEMRPDGKGFHYPAVDNAICIECGACERVCPFPTHPEDVTRPSAAYAAWSNNGHTHTTSTSGGAAYELSRHILSQGGVVYGCTADGLDVRHIRVTDPDQLYRLQGSKYVQSDTRGIFSQVRADLRSGLTVLFIGTPCQTAGLKRFIGKRSDGLYLVDLICHGVPSRQMLLEHLKPLIKGHRIDALSFREDMKFRLRAKEKGTTIYTGGAMGVQPLDLYYDAFLEGTTYRPSCYNCGYSAPQRVSDITIGDFWGLQDADRLPRQREDGVSAILINTPKGEKLIEAIQPQIFSIQRPVEEAIAGNSQLQHPTRRRLPARVFSLLYPTLSFDNAFQGARVARKMQSLIKIIRNGCRR